MPSKLEFRTADEVAETYKVSSSLYRKLWMIQSDATKPTPLGGDGSNGTVETPDGRLSADNDDKAPHWWGQLSEAEQMEIINGGT